MDSRWYLAQTLDERIETLKERRCSDVGTNLELAEKRLARWTTDLPFRDAEVFQQFLDSNGLTEEDFREILGQDKEQIQQATGKQLEWPAQLLDCLDPSDSSASRSTPGFLALVDPLIQHFQDKLQSYVSIRRRKCSTVPPEILVRSLTEGLSIRLQRQIQKTLILEINIARVENRLSGESKEERFNSFVQLLRQREGRLAIFLQYPVMTRRIWQTLERWYAASCELADRLQTDYALLNAEFDLESAPVETIFGGAGDLHLQGRSVHVLEFANQKKVVYKPRPMAVDCLLQEFLQFLADRGLEPDLKISKTLDCGAYGWSEYIGHADCESENQVANFYKRQGVWLAVLYALGATDVHLENLIAGGEYPVVVDLETLFHPELPGRNIKSADDLARVRHADSVISVGLLPVPVRAAGRAMDDSPIGATPDQILPFDVDTVESIDTDEIYVGKAPGRIGEIYSSPRLSGRFVEAVQYHKEIKKGFALAYRFLQSLRGELLQKGGWFDRFSNLPIRAIMRATNFYGCLQLESLHPNANLRGLDQEFVLKDLWTITRNHACFKRVIASERRQLLNGDIPYFATTPNSTDITGGDGTVIESILIRSGLAVAEERLQRMGEADLNFQLWVVDAALQSMSVANTTLLQAKGYPRACSDFLDAAIACGDRLVETAITHEEQNSWLCLAFEGGNDPEIVSCKLGIVDHDLYSGLLGIALFLGYLYSHTGNENFKETAQRCLNQVDVKKHALSKTPGAYAGLCGLLYVHMHLTKLFNSNTLQQNVSLAFDLLPEVIESDSLYDLIYGCAGAIPVLLSYCERFSDRRALELARACGNKLLQDASPGCAPGNLTWSLKKPRGFSHGLSGIAFALSELAAATAEDKYLAACMSVLAEERELLKNNRWTDFPNNAEGVAWCHGAAGIAISRMKIYQRHKVPQAKDDAIKAVRFLLASPEHAEHVICHGALGNLEPLLLACDVLAQEGAWHEALQLRSRRILEDVNESGWKSKLAAQVMEPGLMTGLAGIGFEFLRLHAPCEVPSVLALDTP